MPNITLDLSEIEARLVDLEEDAEEANDAREQASETPAPDVD